MDASKEPLGSASAVQILPFTRPVSRKKRGRPPTARPAIDRGTPELIQKRQMGLTTEVLDICLERNYINEKQHRAALHLRWLHTLRHGNPSLSSSSGFYLQDTQIRHDDPAWRDAREEDYRIAIGQLGINGCLSVAMNCCIYNETPVFLNHRLSEASLSRRYYDNSLDQLRQGLDLLIKLWEK